MDATNVVCEFAAFSAESDALVGFKYSHDRMPKKKASEMSLPMDVQKWKFCLLYMCSTILTSIAL